MIGNPRCRVALLYPGDRESRRTATPEKSRFSKVYAALAALGVHAEPAVYHDDFCEDVRQQLLKADGVLVWANPVEDGRDRSVLDAMLREVAASGVFVSTHPDIILKLGTKEVLYRTRDIGWGCDTHLYTSMDQMRRELPARLAAGAARVLKQYRGHSGDGVWKVELAPTPSDEALVHARHAKRGSVEERISLSEFFRRCERYFAGDGRMIDQVYQARLPEGMVRCYLVHEKVAGFGHQAVNALYPAPRGAPPEDAPQPGPRLYHSPSLPQFQSLKQQLEREWVPAVQRLLDIDTDRLPVLWDCDFLLGPKLESGDDSYVLCEINVSSVSPFPDSAVPLVAQATRARTHAARRGA
ncbi:MAG: Cj0069 family protein [Burkholderiales bacterium]